MNGLKDSESKYLTTAEVTSYQEEMDGKIIGIGMDIAKSKEDGGRILLKIWQEGTVLTISLMDNGQGMNLEEKAALHQKILNSEKTGRSIGLGNIYRRMAVLYPEGQLNVYSMEGRGTIIQLKIPQKEGIHHEI